jgi:hypothetical protein
MMRQSPKPCNEVGIGISSPFPGVPIMFAAIRYV